MTFDVRRLPANEKNALRSATPFGELLKRHRLASGASQEVLAERARISASAIGALERGARRAPYRETVDLLALALGLSDAEHLELEAAAQRARAGHGRAARHADLATHNLPESLTSFVGRDEEITVIASLMNRHRLVTVTGSGGVGKTRTALEVARHLLAEERAVWFVDLSHSGSGTSVAGAIAAALDLPLASAADPMPSLVGGLKTRQLLLILDNCEHVVKDAATTAAAILRACSDVDILATSRERLAIEGEGVYRLPSLPLPDDAPATVEEARAYPALRLFVDRAVALESRLVLTPERLAKVTAICAQLEGIPLALELAATQLPTLGFDALNERLKERLVISSGARDLPQRQRTMVATIAWSHDLLSDRERVLFRRIAIFHGSFMLEAAEEVCSDHALAAPGIAELLSLLVEKSLLAVSLSGERTRYAMLDSVRAFAREALLAAGEVTPMARAHATWLAAVAERGGALYPRLSRSRWLAEFGPEIDNARGALEWTLNEGTSDDVLLAAKILGGLHGLWTLTRRRVECARWTEAALGRVDATSHPHVAASLLSAQIASIDRIAVFAVAERATPLFERIGDGHGLVALYGDVAWEYGMRGAFVEGENTISRALALADEEHLQRSRQYADLLQTRCMIRACALRVSEARIDASSAAALRQAIGEDDLEIRYFWDAFFEFKAGNLQRSEELFEASADFARAQSTSPAGSMCALACVRALVGDIDAAEAAGLEALEWARYEQVGIAWRAIGHLATIAALRGQMERAARLMGFVDAWGKQKLRFRGCLERASHELLTATLQERLPGDAIAEFAAIGSLFDFDRAVEEALAR